jgi:hypothetical protein
MTKASYVGIIGSTIIMSLIYRQKQEPKQTEFQTFLINQNDTRYKLKLMTIGNKKHFNTREDIMQHLIV